MKGNIDTTDIDPWHIALMAANDPIMAAALYIVFKAGIPIKRYKELGLAANKFVKNTSVSREFGNKMIEFVDSLHLNDRELLAMGALLMSDITDEGCLIYGRKLAKSYGLDYDALMKSFGVKP